MLIEHKQVPQTTLLSTPAEPFRRCRWTSCGISMMLLSGAQIVVLVTHYSAFLHLCNQNLELNILNKRSKFLAQLSLTHLHFQLSLTVFSLRHLWAVLNYRALILPVLVVLSPQGIISIVSQCSTLIVPEAPSAIRLGLCTVVYCQA